MVTGALLDREIDAGANIVLELDRRQNHPTAAFWLYNDCADRWRLLLTSSAFASIGRLEAYGALGRILDDMGPAAGGLTLGEVAIFSDRDPVGRMVQGIPPTPGLNRKRMHRTAFNGTYVPDMLLYRKE
jgi:hypothetical protein